MKLSSGVHRVATFTDHKVTGQVGQHAGAATWQPKVSLACCTPVQRKEKCFTSTCSSGYAITVVTVRSLLAVTIHGAVPIGETLLVSVCLKLQAAYNVTS